MAWDPGTVGPRLRGPGPQAGPRSPSRWHCCPARPSPAGFPSCVRPAFAPRPAVLRTSPVSVASSSQAGGSWAFKPGTASRESVHATSTCVGAQGPQRGVAAVTTCPSGCFQEPTWGTGVGKGPDGLCRERDEQIEDPPTPLPRARNGIPRPAWPPPRGKHVADPLRPHLPALPSPGQAGTPGT